MTVAKRSQTCCQAPNGGGRLLSRNAVRPVIKPPTGAADCCRETQPDLLSSPQRGRQIDSPGRQPWDAVDEDEIAPGGRKN